MNIQMHAMHFEEHAVGRANGQVRIRIANCDRLSGKAERIKAAGATEAMARQ
jgi:hypothetical protein